MRTLQLLRVCDHRVVERSLKEREGSVVRRYGGNLIDRLEFAPDIQAVTEVSFMGNKLSEDIYNYYDNTIIWRFTPATCGVGKYRVPSPGESYSVKVIYMHSATNTYYPKECPQCGGNGWYISPLKEGKDAGLITGPLRCAQDFLKALLTARGTDRLFTGYGSGLLTDSDMLYLDKKLRGHIEACVKQAEVQVKKAGSELAKDERLTKAIIEELTIDADLPGVYLVIKLWTAEGEAVRFKLGI